MRVFLGESCEKNISAVCYAQKADSWIPCSNEDKIWEISYQRAESERSCAFSGVKVAVSHGLPVRTRRFFRLVGSDAFEQVFKAGRKRNGRFFVVYWLRDFGGPNSLGMVVPKRLVGTSVQRNKVKRLVRECFRRSLSVQATGAMIVRLQRGYGVGEKKAANHELGALMKLAIS